MTALLRVENLSKSFGGLQVSRNISFSLRQRDRVALIGPNGAGKTTLINLISGVLAPSAGRIFLRDKEITRLGIVRRARLGLVRSFQISRLFSHQTVFENIALPILQRTGRTNRMFGSAAPAMVADEVNEIAGRLELRDILHRQVSGIAYGEQRLAELAMALAMRPDVLLLDEPAAGAGRRETDRIVRAIEQLPADTAILLIDHDMDLVFRFASRVMVMAGGAIIFEGTAAGAKNDEEVRKAYLGRLANDGAIA